MEGTKNINKKLLIAIFTIPFLVGFIYSVYSQATSSQNNTVVSGLESNAVIQGAISLFNSYSIAGQSLASLLSINEVPSYVWAIVIFLITTLFFVGIYIYLFEIFIQRAKISESETMKKAKILFIFALSVFSALAIGYAIPFLFNLYGLVLLIFAIIALFFFGRAVIYYGRSFHHSIKSFAADIEKEFLKAEKELKQAKKDLSEQDVKFLEEGREKVNNYLEKIDNEFNNAEKEFKNTLSSLVQLYRTFIGKLITDYNNYLNKPKLPLQINQATELINFNKELDNKRNSLHPDMQSFPSIRELHNDILKHIQELTTFNDIEKQELRNILDNAYRDIILNSQIPSTIQDTINKYENVTRLLINFNGFKDGFKRDIQVRFRHLFNAPDNRKYEFGILSTLNKSDKYIKEIEKLVDKRIQLLENLLH